MSDISRLSLEGSNVRMDVPSSAYERAIAATDFYNVDVVSSDTVEVHETGQDVQLLFRNDAIGRIHDFYDRSTAVNQLVRFMGHVQDSLYYEELDPALSFSFSAERYAYSIFYADAQLPWPEGEVGDLSSIATNVMRQAAVDLNYIRDPSEIPATVGAVVDRRNGIMLLAGADGASGMMTDGSDYEPDDPILRLQGANLYQNEMQLTCLSGLIAITRAHET
jgi:hypothetical protein